jgi:hypothetical protein
MIEHIESTMFDQVHPREFHDLPDLRLIFTVVALGFAFLAHGFGIVGTFHPHRQTIREKAVTIRAEENPSLCKPFQVNELKRKRKLFSVVILTAINPHELHQGLNIGSLFLRHLILSQHLPAPFLDFT